MESQLEPVVDSLRLSENILDNIEHILSFRSRIFGIEGRSRSKFLREHSSLDGIWCIDRLGRMCNKGLELVG